MRKSFNNYHSVPISFFNMSSMQHDEYFCLDKDGIVYPLFEEIHCEIHLDDTNIPIFSFSFIMWVLIN